MPIRPVRLRTYLTLLVVAVLIPVIGLAAYLSLLSAHAERASLERGMRDTARALSLAVDGQVAMAKSSLDALAAGSSFRSGDFAQFRTEADRFLQSHAGWLSIVDESGQQHLNTRLPVGAELPKTDNHDWLGHIFTANPHFITGAVSGPVVKDTFVAISRRASTDGATELVLTLSLAPDTLSRLLMDQGLPRGWYGVIADRQGIIIGRTKSMELIGRPMTIRLTGKDGFEYARTWENEPVYIAWATSPVTGWSTGVAAPAALFDNVRTFAWLKIVAIALISLVLASLAALFVGRRLTKPLNNLVAEVKGGGPLPGSELASPVDELNTLASAFRSKVSQLVAAANARDAAQAELRDLNQELEQRVMTRTAEIEQLGNRVFQLQKQESIGRLTAGIAHDFNNLLTAVMGNLELLERRLTDNPALRYVTNAQKAARRGAELTSHLLAFSRKQHLDPKPVDVNASAQAMAEMFRATLGGTIRIETQLSPNRLFALTDQTQLDLILLNLAINARDAMPGGGLLTLETYEQSIDTADGTPEAPPVGDYVVIALRDTGTGMSEEVRSRVFEPYFTTKPVGKGSGLGLPHVLGVAKQSGGGLRLYSVLNGGTRIEVFLPICRDAETETGVRPSAMRPAFNDKCVLLVDDDPDVRMVSAHMLREIGCKVVEAESGAKAIEMIQSGGDHLAAAVLDYAMPGRNGVEVAEQIREILPALPIVIVSGYADTERLSKSWDGPLLNKPFDLAQLSDVMARLLMNDAVIRVNFRARP